MKISTKGRYGLRIMTELASQYGKGPVLAETIAKNQAISAMYIHNIVSSLKKAGLVEIVRGPKGGYKLRQEPKKITALDVIRTLEGPIECVACVSEPGKCDRVKICPTRDVWKQVTEAVVAVLKGITLEDLASVLESKTIEPYMYYV